MERTREPEARAAMMPGMATALLDRAREGDREAFGALAEEHRAGLLRLCLKMTGSPEEAEDLVQETLLKAYLRITDFELRSSMRTWLYRIATNACLDHARARKPWDLEKRFGWFRENGELVQQMEQTLYLSPERAAEVKEVAATCVNCVTMSLPAKQRAAITLCDQLGLSREEAAQAIGASVASVKTELHRARKKMADVYEDHCALVHEENECDGCLWAGRVQRRGATKASARAEAAVGEAAERRPSRATRAAAPRAARACAAHAEAVSELAAGTAGGGDAAVTRAHIASCAGCAAAYRRERRTVRFVRSQADVPLDPATPGGRYMSFTAALARGEDAGEALRELLQTTAAAQAVRTGRSE